MLFLAGKDTTLGFKQLLVILRLQLEVNTKTMTRADTQSHRSNSKVLKMGSIRIDEKEKYKEKI